MSSSPSKSISYYNTLIFTIISGIISLLLLIALFFDIFKDYITFIITVEVGIFIIIGGCIWAIIANEQLIDKYKQAKNFNIDFTTCPDYFIQRNEGGKNICSNEYITEDEYKNKFLTKIYPVDNIDKNEMYPLPKLHVHSYVDSTKPYDKYDSSIIETATDLKETRDKCAAVLGQNINYKLYSAMPWTSAIARCESFAK
uniref:Uncharacterized protein n=1 Tax=viral metagenome TaxID=1070528 RepID=A0A6C0BEE3_9ZZZZ